MFLWLLLAGTAPTMAAWLCPVRQRQFEKQCPVLKKAFNLV